MDYIPLNYRQLNIATNMFMPNTVKSYNNKTFEYWSRALFQRACSVFEFVVPESWQGSPTDFLYWCLFRFGFVLVWNDPEFGYTFNPCTVSGYNVYYQPTHALVSNPAFKKSKGKKFELGKDGQLLKMAPDLFPCWDTIVYYAEKLSTLDVALNTSLINSKLSLVLGASNKSGSESIKHMLEKINRGEPACIVDKTIMNDASTKEPPFTVWEQDVKGKYISDMLLADLATILKNFDSEVGIPTISEKKERLVTSEAEAKQVDCKARSLVWFDTMVNSIDKIKELYPDIKLDVKLRYDTEKGGDDLVVRETDFNRPD